MNQSTGNNNFLAPFLHPNPERDWFFALSVALVPFIFFIGYAAYLFFGIQSGLAVHSMPASFPAQTITEEEIQSALDSYRSRKARYEINVVPSIPNPVTPKTTPIGQ